MGEIESTAERRGRRAGGGREARRAVRTGGGLGKRKFISRKIPLYETLADEGLELIEKVGADNFGLLLDTFHMNIEAPSIEQSIRNAGNRIFHFHIADSNRWYPGAGHLDFKRIVEVLENINYAGYLSAEILPLPNPDSCAQETKKTMEGLLS